LPPYREASLTVAKGLAPWLDPGIHANSACSRAVSGL
jgi:hypothetical protein